MSALTPYESPSRPRRGRVATAGIWIAGFIALLWVLEAVDTVLGGALDVGVRPLTTAGLWGIATAPFMHFGWVHLMSNTGPLLVLGFLVLLSGVRRWVEVSVVVALVSGLGTWFFGGQYSNHLGASGLLFGWLAYLLVRGVVSRSAGQIVLGVVVFLVYGTMLWGVFPTTYGVSWQMHLFGAVGGVVAAWLLERPSRPRTPERAELGW